MQIRRIVEADTRFWLFSFDYKTRLYLRVHFFANCVSNEAISNADFGARYAEPERDRYEMNL